MFVVSIQYMCSYILSQYRHMQSLVSKGTDFHGIGNYVFCEGSNRLRMVYLLGLRMIVFNTVVVSSWSPDEL